MMHWPTVKESQIWRLSNLISKKSERNQKQKSNHEFYLKSKPFIDKCIKFQDRDLKVSFSSIQAVSNKSFPHNLVQNMVKLLNHTMVSGGSWCRAFSQWTRHNCWTSGCKWEIEKHNQEQRGLKWVDRQTGTKAAVWRPTNQMVQHSSTSKILQCPCI